MLHSVRYSLLTLLGKSLRKSFGLEGQKYIQQYDWDKIAEKEYQLITNVMTMAK